MQSKTGFFVLSLATLMSLGLGGSGIARADDATAKQLFDEAQKQFAARAGLGSAIDEAIKLSQAAEDAVTDDTGLKYDILILASRALYFKGTKSPATEDKLSLFNLGMTKTNTAKAINKDYADSYYFYSVNLGAWAQARGIIESLARKAELITNLRESLNRESKAGAPKGTIDGYGPHRILGRLYFKLPVPAGGSHTRSVEYLRRAAIGAPGFALNLIYLCETLIDSTDAAEKSEAKTILEEMVKVPAGDAKWDATRPFETGEELERARNLLKDIS